MAYRLGIDLGGTSAKVALVTSSLKIVDHVSIVTEGFPRPLDVVKKISKVCHPWIKKHRVKHVGVGVAGDIDFERGVVRISPNLKWHSVPLRSLLSKALRCPVLIDNDANAAAWGLYKSQVPKTVKHFMAVTLGTGVGGGIVLARKLYRGGTGSAGEIGHIIIDEKGALCNCGNRGCLETYVGGPHIIRKVRKALQKGQKSSLRRLFQTNPDQLTPYSVSQAALKGDSFAQSIWDEVGRALGFVLGHCVYLFNPEMIFLTGGVAQAKALILKPLWKKLKERTFKTPIRCVQIKIASNAPHIGVIGASLLEN